MRKYIYVVEYRARAFDTKRWRAWMPSIDAGIPFMNKPSAVRCMNRLRRGTKDSLQYRVVRYQRPSQIGDKP